MKADYTVLRKEEPIAKDRYPDLYDQEGKIILESNSAKEFLKDYKQPVAFNKIGYSRSLGGFFYQFFFAILGAGVLAIFYPLMLKFMYPFPNSKSYVSIAGVLFAFLQTIMNVPTGYAIEMFIGEWRIKDPTKMVQYLRFYIWYQMMTGVFLVAGFSYFTLNILNSGNSLEWAKWLMLILIAREYPANTGVFLSSLKGLQRFDLESWCNFVNDTFIRPGFEIGFVLWGRFVLGADPRFGELIGVSIGFAIGTYVDDFISMIIAGKLFKKALKTMDLKLIDVFIPHVERQVMINAIRFGFWQTLPGIFGSFFGTMTALWLYSMLPAYLTLSALSGVADELANIIKRGGGINIKATISEAHNNGKIALTSYYIAMSWKYIFFFAFAIGSILFSFMPLLLGTLFEAVGATEYVLAGAFIIPNIIGTIIEEPSGCADMILVGSNKVKFNSSVNIILDTLNVVFLFIWLFIVQVGNWGIIGLVWWIPLNGFPSGLARMIIKWYYIHKRVAPVQFNKFYWQAFVAPLLPSIIISIIAISWTTFIFPDLQSVFQSILRDQMGGTLVAGAITILFGFIFCLMFTFFPLYTAFGGNDTNTLEIFDGAVKISGPSQFLFRPINAAQKWLAKISKLHNKFVIPYEDAEREAKELMQEKYIKDCIVKQLKQETDGVII